MFIPDRGPELYLLSWPCQVQESKDLLVEQRRLQNPGRQPARIHKGPLKFMLGVNSPVVWARIVKRILNCDFGDIATLSNENLEIEKRRCGSREDANATPRAKLRLLPDLLAWSCAFSLLYGCGAQKIPQGMG